MESLRYEDETIVEYSMEKPAFNGYPEKIVSPLDPGDCCAAERVVVGGVHWDSNEPFVYNRCQVCGYTVRHFLSRGQTLVMS